MVKGRLFAILFVTLGLVLAFSGLPFIDRSKDLGYVERLGVIEATEVHLSAKVAERIAAIPFQEGDVVPLGAPVVQLHRAELEAEAAQAETEVRQAESEIVTAEAVHAKALAALAETRRNLDRRSKLHRDRLIATAELEEAQTQFDLAAAEVDVAKARIGSTEARLAQAQAHLHLFRVRIEERTLIAPITGVVTLKAYEAGEMAAPGLTLVTLTDLSSLWARIDLEEGEIGKIRLGGTVDLFLSSDRASAVPGKVIEIGTAGDFATQRDTTRGRQDVKTFRVKIRVPPSEGRFKPGMTVAARIYTEGTNGDGPIREIER